jgi:hypothetical protein
VILEGHENMMALENVVLLDANKHVGLEPKEDERG